MILAVASAPLGARGVSSADESSLVLQGEGSVHARVRIPGATLLGIDVDGLREEDSAGVVMNGPWHVAPLSLFGVPIENPVLQSTWLRYLVFVKGPNFQMPRSFLNPNGGPSQFYFLGEDEYDLYAIAPEGRPVSFTFTFDRPGTEILSHEPWEGHVQRLDTQELVRGGVETRRADVSMPNGGALLLAVDMETTITVAQYYNEIHRARQGDLNHRCAYGGPYFLTAVPTFPTSWVHQAWSEHRLSSGDWTVGVDLVRNEVPDPPAIQVFAMTFPLHPGDDLRHRPHGIVGGYIQGFTPEAVRDAADNASCVDPFGRV